ncbi:hypothetical protein AN189_16400 [Loktanella sp. 3ANDIMAR09]|uniref:hypothetical protein n=1 Tax=Loktanella sp. 3ANDIMAR09 TaxID=1225657 RepID=UPI0006FAD5AF|nr:hypothetical protein [Loktanella sp. 3ANDIMAR09]KQI67186.1 hypothetical protein AN189_16400 [Loktanella sp. 3ANDIMAR09]
MNKFFASIATAFAVFASPAAAEVVPLVAAQDVADGPYIDVAQTVSYSDAPTTLDDIHALADLDGDPSVVTDREREMIALLSMMLIGTPVQN